jgi:hypothetical protein
MGRIENPGEGSCVNRFEACSAFTSRYGLHARQVTYVNPLHRRLRRFRFLHRRSDCFRVERTQFPGSG